MPEIAALMITVVQTRPHPPSTSRWRSLSVRESRFYCVDNRDIRGFLVGLGRFVRKLSSGLSLLHKPAPTA
jgi:hypothetical protein